MSEKEISVRVRDLSKKYVIDRAGQRDNTLRDLAVRKISRLVKPRRKNRSNRENLWALKDVSFDVYRGETLGIIGRNGAGKSTILKILSRVVEPTSGTISVNGRVGSLLEVGTGFHPELTGRENVYFNGSILGMTKKEINQRFDEIVEFSEIERFIDVPVKFYSSGMYVRLAFAIAAHLDPEVLIIDEALAVGDIAFQQKCIEKMRASARSGKTVLFVSHSMNIIEDLCDRVLYLENGKLQAVGEPSKVVSRYIGLTTKNLGTSWKIDKSYIDKPGNPVLPLSMKLLASDGKPLGAYIAPGVSVVVDSAIEIKQLTKDLSIGISLFNEAGLHVWRSAVTDEVDETKRVKLVKGKNCLQLSIDTSELIDGTYIVALDCDLYKKEWIHNPYFSQMRTQFIVKNDGSAKIGLWDKEREGFIKPNFKWEKL